MSRLSRSSRFENRTRVLGQHREQDPPGYSPDDVVTVDQHRPVEKLPVSQDDKEKIAHLNAEKLFSL